MEYRKIVIVSGGYDPLHSGHIELLKDAKTYGDCLIVALNSDNWLIRKKGKYFMPYAERSCILSHLKPVNWVMNFDDDDDTACDAIKQVQEAFPEAEIIFANGGDRNSHNIPEMKYCDFYNVRFVFGVGGSYKKNSSSEILLNWTNNAIYAISNSNRPTSTT